MADEKKDMGLSAEKPQSPEERLAFVKGLFETLTADERHDIMLDYCAFCGGPSDCQCWNDE